MNNRRQCVARPCRAVPSLAPAGPPTYHAQTLCRESNINNGHGRQDNLRIECGECFVFFVIYFLLWPV